MARDNNQFVYVDILQLMQDGFLCENPSEDVIFSNLEYVVKYVCFFFKEE